MTKNKTDTEELMKSNHRYVELIAKQYQNRGLTKEQLIEEGNKGMEYAAVIIEDGETAVPDAVITIKKVKVDGKDVELKKKSFTYTDAGKLRSNIFNEWISDDGLPDDSRCDKGALFNNYDNTSPSDINDGSYSAQLIDTGAFDEWTKVEVEFSISGLDK